jgi:hypothetical protein
MLSGSPRRINPIENTNGGISERPRQPVLQVLLAIEFLGKQPTGNPNSDIVLVIKGVTERVHEVINGMGVPSQPLQLVICPHPNALYSTLFRLTLTRTCFLTATTMSPRRFSVLL